jgi:hypothetical protein
VVRVVLVKVVGPSRSQDRRARWRKAMRGEDRQGEGDAMRCDAVRWTGEDGTGGDNGMCVLHMYIIV